MRNAWPWSRWRGAVVSHLDLLRGAGLQPQALEIGPVAIKRLIGALSERSMLATVLVINFGRPITEGTPAEVQKHPEVLKAYLGEEEGECSA